MAFGFIKKIFSFGKKEVVEVEQPAETPVETLAPAPGPAALEIAVGTVSEASRTGVEPHIPEPEQVETTVVEPAAVAPAPKPEKPRPSLKKPVPARKAVEREAPAEVPETEIAGPFADKTIEAPAAVFETPPAEPALHANNDQLLAGETIFDAPDVLQPETFAVDTQPEDPSNKILIGATEENTFVPAPEPDEKLSWFGRLTRGLSRSSKELTSSVTGIFLKRKLDEETLQELEDVLIQADLGMETALRITDTLSSGRYGKQISDEEVRAIMSAEIEKVLTLVAKPLELDLSHKPHVILVVGVNGTGKTTTIGKLSAKLRAANLNVWLAAGDTFRAAAIEQLHIWGERTGSPVVSTKIGADAAGLAYDAYEKAKIGGADVLIIDTAGRLQNRTELMDELAKIVRVLNKLDPEAPHTVLQTLDATTGQNALSQVEIFKNVAGVNGLVMTKLDGTARGGILVAIAARHKLPVYFIGVGETVDDLEPFSAKEFASAIAGTE